MIRLREIAAEKGMSMGRLSRMADISLPTIRKIYREDFPYSAISLGTLDKIAKALSVSIHDLIEEDVASQA